MGLQAGQGLLLGGDLPGQGPAPGRVGQGGPLPPSRRDQVHHRLGLGQAELAVEEGAAGVLAGGGGGGAGGKAGFHQAAGHRVAAVAGQLDRILAGVAVGGAEKQGDAVVKEVAAVRKLPVEGGIALCVGHPLAAIHRAKDLFGHPVAVGARQPHHRDAPLPRGGGDGCDRTVFHHAASFLLCCGSC